jgi:uroporphyrinogen decarboxylase
MCAMLLGPSHPLHADATAQARLTGALTGNQPEITPVWFMRQAGRSLPEYRALRVGNQMLDACLSPTLASEITLQPVRRHGVDAGIFFSDIVVPLRLVGVDVRIEPGTGPVFGQPLEGGREVAALTRIDPRDVIAAGEPVWEAVALAVSMLRSLGAERGEPLPLIGFAGAPFTLAAYMVEGRPSKDQWAARALMHRDPAAWSALMEWTADLTGLFLRCQVENGASAGQLFDTWAGNLSADDYVRYAAPATSQALSHLRDLTYHPGPAADERERPVPIIHFGLGTGELLGAMRDVGVDALGIDYRIPLDEANRRLGGAVALQGNLDPSMLAAPDDVLTRAVIDVLERGAPAPGHVFNLGHGVPAAADPDVLSRVVTLVHEWRRPAGAADA